MKNVLPQDTLNQVLQQMFSLDQSTREQNIRASSSLIKLTLIIHNGSRQQRCTRLLLQPCRRTVPGTDSLKSNLGQRLLHYATSVCYPVEKHTFLLKYLFTGVISSTNIDLSWYYYKSLLVNYSAFDHVLEFITPWNWHYPYSEMKKCIILKINK